MNRDFPWTTLGIDQTHDTAAIRKAYADRLRSLNVDEDIAGYAALRRARDEALWLAAQGAPDDTGDYGLGSLDDGEPDILGADLAAGSGGDLDFEYADAQDASGRDLPATEVTEPQRRAQDAWQALTDILYPGGEASEESVTYAEMEEGLAHLAVLLDHAEQADLVEHDALDGALADVFARTWPRSAPFVEPANVALHWLDEAGSLEERPALMFLNQRLKGMRFHDKVQVADHPLHKAWTELSRPGRASFVDRLRVKRLDIDKLLTGLRQHYPELESHLEPERVASWEGSTNASGVSDTGPKVVRWIFIAVLIGSVLARLGAGIADNDSAASAPSNEEVNAALVDAQINIAAPEVFGPGTDFAALRKADPVFVDQLRLAMGQGSNADVALAFTRVKALGAGEVADFDTLVVRAELRRLWLGAALRQPAAVCQKVLVGDLFRTLPALTEDERDRERALLRQMLDAKMLSHQAKGGTTQFGIPGWVIGEIITRSGLGEDAVRAAFQDTSNPNRCKVEIALLDVIIAKPGRVSVDLLRGL